MSSKKMSGCGGWTADTVQDYLKSKKVEKKLKKIKLPLAKYMEVW
jgi:hypothetical protein